jgi:hypothetical protein
MFKIYDGRKHFYQWDSDRKLIVEDPLITEVHFCNRTDDCSLVCETYVEDGITLVNVPNILLQTDWRIHVYAVDSNYTKYNKYFEVISRTKPADYVYTETEVVTWNAFETRVDEKIEEIEETAKSANANSSEAKVNSEMAETKADSAIENAESALVIAKGANQAVSFADYEEMAQSLSNAPADKYNVGQNIMILKLNVPDLWVSYVYEWHEFHYTTEEDFIEWLKGGSIQIGYYAISQLETQKVDLSVYAKKEQVPVITTTLKENGAYTLTITKGVE